MNVLRKKWLQVFFLSFWVVNNLIPVYAGGGQPDPAFNIGKDLGTSFLQKSRPSIDTIGNIPGYDPTTNYQQIGEQYYKSGVVHSADMTDVYQAGQAELTCNPHITCNENDEACKKSVVECKAKLGHVNAYANDMTGQLEKSREMRGYANQIDAASVLGLNIPEQHENVCVTSTVSIPEKEEIKRCLTGTYYTFAGVDTLEPIQEQQYSDPICPDGYSINEDTSMCEKKIVVCPNGYNLENGECKRPAYCYDADASAENISAAQCPSNYIETGSDQCRQDVYSCNPGDTGGGIFNSECLNTETYTADGQVSKTCPANYPFYVGIGDDMYCADGYPGWPHGGYCPNGGTGELIDPWGYVCNTGSTNATANYEECPDGYVTNGTTCERVVCESGGTQYPGSHFGIDPYPACSTGSTSLQTYYNCPSGYSYSGGGQCTKSSTSVEKTSASCPDGWGDITLDNGTRGCFANPIPGAGCPYVFGGTAYCADTTSPVCPSTYNYMGGFECSKTVTTTDTVAGSPYTQCPSGYPFLNTNNNTCHSGYAGNIPDSYDRAFLGYSCPTTHPFYPGNGTLCYSGYPQASDTNKCPDGGDFIWYTATWLEDPQEAAQEYPGCRTGAIAPNTDILYSCPQDPDDVLVEEEETCYNYTYYTGVPTSFYSDKQCPSGSEKMQSFWSTESAEGHFEINFYEESGGIEVADILWGNEASSGSLLPPGEYSWDWVVNLQSVDGIKINGITLLHDPLISEMKFYINGKQITGDSASGVGGDFVDGLNTLRMVFVNTQITNKPGIRFEARRLDGVNSSMVPPNCIVNQGGSYCSAGGSLSGNQCCLPEDIQPVTEITLQEPFTCSPEETTESMQRCADGHVFNSETKMCTHYVNKDKSPKIGMTDQTAQDMPEQKYWFFTTGQGELYYKDFIDGDSTERALSLGDNSKVRFSLNPDNLGVQIEGRLFYEGLFDTRIGGNTIEFFDGSEHLGYLSFSTSGNSARITGHVDTGQFQITTDGGSCLTFWPDGRQICFSDAIYSCPYPYEDVSGTGAPAQCKLPEYEPINYCPTDFWLIDDTTCSKEWQPDTTINQCVTSYLSCPDGLSLVDGQCKNADEELGKGEECELVATTEGEEAYLCKAQRLDECSALDKSTCSLLSTSCIDNLQVPGSEIAGQCVMEESVYSCTTPAHIKENTTCGFEPMCFNGNCFQPPGVQCEGIMEEKTQTVTRSCFRARAQEIHECSVSYTYDPDQGYIDPVLGDDCQEYVDDSACRQYPLMTNDEGMIPSKAAFSCLGEWTDSCDSLENDETCSGTPVSSCVDHEELAPRIGTELLTSANTEVASTGRCIYEEVDYSCINTNSVPGDECTADLSKVLISMEASTQAGTYIDPADVKIFKGEYARCDRRVASVWGGKIDSKSCCNIDAPDPVNNEEGLSGQLMDVGMSFVTYGVEKGSAYMYDFMMESENFANAAIEAWSSGFLSDNMAFAANGTESLASSVNFTPSIGLGMGTSIAYAGGSAAAAGTTMAGSSTILGQTVSSYSFGLGGGFQLTFTPVMFYIQAFIMAYGYIQKQLACDEMDYLTASRNEASLCYKTRSFCADKDCGIFGCVCRKYRTEQCCYNSRLAKIINEQGKSQLGIMGEYDDCSGFTVEQLEALDWSRIDLTEFIAELMEEATGNIPSEAQIKSAVEKVGNQIDTGSKTINRESKYIP